MRLKSFETDTFAGITNRKLRFEDGLNVILGPNEAGKSTVVEAIFATIFKDAKLRMNLGADKEFKKRFMPYPDGDYINGILEFDLNGQHYKLKKEWGEEHSIFLELPDSTILKNNKRIGQYLKELFTFGQATYGNVVFARQREVKQVIQRILSDDRIINTVSAFLRKAVMELEGISVEKLRNRISEELNTLCKRWDLVNNRPDNPNRDINNPFKVGYGKIYEIYLKKAGTELEMEKTREIEEKFEQISLELKELEEKRDAMIKKINEMARLEDDIFKRGSLEPEIKRLEEKSITLKKINSQWPLKEDQLKRKGKELEDLDKTIESLKEEKVEARKKLDIEKDKKIVDKTARLKDKIEEKINIQSKLSKISAEDIGVLEKLDNILKKDEAFLQASTLLAKINKAEGEILVSRGVNDKEAISSGKKIKANAYLRIEVEDKLDIEIQSGEINFEELKVEYKETKKRLKGILDKLKVDSISSARLNREKYINIKNEINNYQQQIDNLLDGRDYQQLKERLDKIKNNESVRDLDEVEKELEEKNHYRTELIAEIKTLDEQLKNWQEDYGEADNLLDKLVEIKLELKNYKKQLEGLVELPGNFKTAEEFKTKLTLLRNKKEEINELFSEKKETLANITAELPDESYEELAVLVNEYEQKYNALVKRAKDLLKTQEVVEKKLEELDNGSFTPLLKSFNKYLSVLTGGNYKLGEIDDKFSLEIKNNDKVLPVDINFLSYGTYDGVALAFRFALIEQLFAEGGFIILDDCLVNLDPERKKEAVKLINKFSEEYQLIFTTCNPDTARELGGNIIEFSY